jgi:hypothetical protein
MRRSSLLVTLSAVVATGAAAGLAATGGSAQAPGPTPTVTITLAPRSVSVEPQQVPAGPTRIVFRTATSGQDAEGSLAALRDGRTLADVRTALQRARRGPGPLKDVLTFEAGGFVPGGGTYATTIDLRAGATYVAAGIADDAASSPLAALTVTGDPGGGTRPQPAATVELFDYAYGMPGTLPRQGTIRFTNRGERLHIAVAFPLRRGANRTRALYALIRNQEREFGRYALERGTFEPLGVVSGGTTNDVEVSFPRGGDWILACFIGDGEPGNPSHNTIGMVRAFTVR